MPEAEAWILMSPVSCFSDSVPNHARDSAALRAQLRLRPEKEEVTPDLPGFLSLHLSFAKSHPRPYKLAQDTIVTTY